MKHCVAIHETSIASGGKYYVYRVVAPERATLALRRTYRGWTIDELQGRRNQAVSPETHSRVQAWYQSVSRTRSDPR